MLEVKMSTTASSQNLNGVWKMAVLYFKVSKRIIAAMSRVLIANKKTSPGPGCHCKVGFGKLLKTPANNLDFESRVF